MIDFSSLHLPGMMEEIRGGLGLEQTFNGPVLKPLLMSTSSLDTSPLFERRHVARNSPQKIPNPKPT
jgi:hypothetical protein